MENLEPACRDYERLLEMVSEDKQRYLETIQTQICRACTRIHNSSLEGVSCKRTHTLAQTAGKRACRCPLARMRHIIHQLGFYVGCWSSDSRPTAARGASCLDLQPTPSVALPCVGVEVLQEGAVHYSPQGIVSSPQLR